MDVQWYRQLGERIARLRGRNSLTQEELAERADITPSYLARIEAGSRRPTLDVVGRIAAGLGMHLDRLLVLEDRSFRAAQSPERARAPARQLGQIVQELTDHDVELLVTLARRLRRR